MRVLLVLIILIACNVFGQPYPEYTADSLAVRAILDSNGLDSVHVTDCTHMINFRVTRFFPRNIYYLPAEVKQLTSLRYLRITTDSLHFLPDEISELAVLETLYVDNVKLGSFPPALCNLAKLKFLSGVGNHLTILPDNFGLLTGLREIDLSNNNLESLPVSIGDLVNLVKLNLEHNSLVSLPSSIGNLNKLERLNLAYNKLVSLPDEICNLTELYDFKIYNNKLENLPDRIGNLRKIRILSFRNNNLSSLPASFANMVNLEKLYLENNKFTKIPEVIASLNFLKTFDMTGNLVSGLTALDIQYLANIEYINLSYNLITDIPPEIKNIGFVKILNLVGNLITTLPPEIGGLTPNPINGITYSYSWFLDSNNISELPMEIMNMGFNQFGISYNNLCNLQDTLEAWLNYNAVRYYCYASSPYACRIMPYSWKITQRCDTTVVRITPVDSHSYYYGAKFLKLEKCNGEPYDTVIYVKDTAGIISGQTGFDSLIILNSLPVRGEIHNHYSTTYGPPGKIFVIKEILENCIVDVEKFNPLSKERISLSPNPFNPSTVIKFSLDNPEIVTIKAFNIEGKLIETLIDSYKNKGHYMVTFNAEEYSSGIYYFKLIIGNRIYIIKGILLK